MKSSALHLLFSLFRVHFTLNDTGTLPRTQPWLPCSLVLPPQWRQIPKHLVTYGSLAEEYWMPCICFRALKCCFPFWASYFLKWYWPSGTLCVWKPVREQGRSNPSLWTTSTCTAEGQRDGCVAAFQEKLFKETEVFKPKIVNYCYCCYCVLEGGHSHNSSVWEVAKYECSLFLQFQR